MVIVPHAIALTTAQVEKMTAFIGRGNKLFIDGFSGIYDENEKSTLSTGFYLGDLVGGTVKDIRFIEEPFDVPLLGAPSPLPASTWQCEITKNSGTPIAEKDGRVLGLKNAVGSGEVVWIPQGISLEAWTHGNDKLADWLAVETAEFRQARPLGFESRAKGCLMQVMQSGEKYVTVVVNQNAASATLRLVSKAPLQPTVIFGRADAIVPVKNALTLNPKETTVIVWKRPDRASR